MEKITLKPTVKELICRNGEEGLYFDVLSYQGAGHQEKTLGSLFVIGQVKYTEEDLSYAVSLVSSLAKREYYSEQSLQGQNTKKAFEHTLGKLNEVLDDFFKNKGPKLSIGLMAISGNNVYISRLGKFKVALARDDQYIDILNNVELFNKDSEDVKQFSNIISGKLHPHDKIFAYLPTRSLSAREKQLNEIFVKEDQDAFGQKIAHLAANANHFTCCGIHITMREIKEIPIEARSSFSGPLLTSKLSRQETPTPEQKITAQSGSDTQKYQITTAANNKNEEATAEEVAFKPKQSELTQPESPRIIPAEFSITKRANLLTPLLKQLPKFKNLGRLGFRAQSRGFLLIATIVMLPLLAIIIFRSIGPSSAVKNAIDQASENLRLAQSQLNQSKVKEARSLLQATLSNTIGLSDKKIEKLREEINQTLNSVNHTSDKQPQLYLDLSANETYANTAFISVFSELIAAANPTGSLLSLNPNGASALAQLKTNPKFLFNTGSAISVFNGSESFEVYNLETKKIGLYSLKDPLAATDAVVYENNLYLLANNNIYKYADAVTGGVKKTVWAGDIASETLVALTADGNIYTLNTDGQLTKYFKGKKDGELDLPVVPSSDSRIFTFKDSAFVYLTDKQNKKIYVFDKTSGELKTTYDFSLAGAITDITISPDGTVWALSSENKIWTIQ